ncbi:MAG: ComF family protein [Bacteroidota bacterium]
MKTATSIFSDFLSLIYPRICMACGKSLMKYEKCICTFCMYHLPRTNFHKEKENPVSKLFWGKINIESASAYYYFYKKGKVQQLMHQLKYKGQKEIGIFLGSLYGKELAISPWFNKANYIVPVPLHPKKEKIRGYNQSEIFALGLSEGMKIPVDTHTLIKTSATETQTKKSRFSRWENVKEVFTLQNAERFKNKHILLVDDVITTGATIESCVLKLQQSEGIKISVVSMAYAYH